MNQSSLPLIVDASQLETAAGQANLLIIDLSKAETHLKYHIPGAVLLDYNQIIAPARVPKAQGKM